MLNFESFITYPFVYSIPVLFLLVRYREKFLQFLPNNKRKLDNLILADTNCDSTNNDLKKFLDEEIKKTNFILATGLIKNNRNEKLVSHYNTISDDILWHEFIKIKRHIKGFIGFKKIGCFKIKFPYYIKSTIWISFSILGFFLAIVYCIKNKSQFNLEFYNIIVAIFFSTIASFCLFLSQIFVLRIIRKYDKIIEQRLNISTNEIESVSEEVNV